MANRVIAAKITKMKRMRRAWARSLVRKGGFNPNREVIKEYSLRARGLAVDETAADKIAAELLRKDGEGPLEKRIPPGRVEALQKQAELEAELPNACNMRVIGPTGVDQLQESWIYFNSRKDCFVLVHRDLTEGIERKSTAYSSKELLLMCWEGDAILWVSKKLIEL